MSHDLNSRERSAHQARSSAAVCGKGSIMDHGASMVRRERTNFVGEHYVQHANHVDIFARGRVTQRLVHPSLGCLESYNLGAPCCRSGSCSGIGASIDVQGANCLQCFNCSDDEKENRHDWSSTHLLHKLRPKQTVQGMEVLMCSVDDSCGNLHRKRYRD